MHNHSNLPTSQLYLLYKQVEGIILNLDIYFALLCLSTRGYYIEHPYTTSRQNERARLSNIRETLHMSAESIRSNLLRKLQRNWMYYGERMVHITGLTPSFTRDSLLIRNLARLPSEVPKETPFAAFELWQQLRLISSLLLLRQYTAVQMSSIIIPLYPTQLTRCCLLHIASANQRRPIAKKQRSRAPRTGRLPIHSAHLPLARTLGAPAPPSPTEVSTSPLSHYPTSLQDSNAERSSWGAIVFPET